MILVFPIDDDTKACIAWGKIQGDMNAETASPITMTEYQNGTKRLSFRMTVSSKNTGGSGKNARWERETANVSVWERDYDRTASKLADVTKLFRKGDTLLVFGRYRSYEWHDREGTARTSHDISADAVIPFAWLYDIILALFAQVVAKAAQPKMKQMEGAAPRKGQEKTPQITHPRSLGDEGKDWFE